jgi:gamma-glutamyltranspeptidase/glutathione hydrolase
MLYLLHTGSILFMHSLCISLSKTVLDNEGCDREDDGWGRIIYDTAMNKGMVTTGNSQTTHAASEILKAGGNAYDAILAAILTAPLSEPVLTSLGGGGHMLSYSKDSKAVLYDFFAHTPGSKKLDAKEVDFFPAIVDFGGTTQEFHIGMGSIAVPGVAKGIFEIHKDLGSMPLKEIAAPAIEYARKGVVIDELQSMILDLVEPIFTSTEVSRKQYGSPNTEGALLRAGEIYKNQEYAAFLEELVAQGDRLFYEGEIAQQIVKDVRGKGGYLTLEDLRDYKVERRDPVSIRYRGHDVITNSPPSSGGLLIAFSLKLLEHFDIAELERKGVYHETLARVMEHTNIARGHHVNGQLFTDGIVERLLDPALVKKYKDEVLGATPFSRGTTHMSVVDAEGNCASMTTSNGEGSGYIVPGTGVLLNNMLGEEDLHPNGFHKWNENERISSMMSPSVLVEPNGSRMALGSGGSNRIRTAVLQVLVNHIDRGMNIVDAIKEPRVHFERDQLNAEPGLDPQEIVILEKMFDDFNVWDEKSMFYGGVHAAGYNTNTHTFFGAGDERRGGATEIVK